MANFDKYADGLMPAVIQDFETGRVLMLGFMNEEAYKKTIAEGKITFFSRSKNRLWTKGESSGNFLFLKSYRIDCDNDTLLFQVEPAGPVCHTGTDTCFGEDNPKMKNFFPHQLEQILEQRLSEGDKDSYTVKLFNKGLHKVAQKVGEEAVEVVIDAVSGNRERLKEEAADLLYHLSLLLKMSNLSFSDVEKVLEERHLKKNLQATDKVK
jgi:phosphoribosyl-ATP pyrophosphohydrolase/phosphoribosyl-AMP cyclohydrolase